MEITITPSKLKGSVAAIPSKSQAHRMLICAAFSKSPCKILCSHTNQDIDATVSCLQALGATIIRKEGCFQVEPIKAFPHCAVLDCGESGSTLRFLLPVVGAMGITATFVLHGRLSQRPLSPLWEEMERMGCQLTRPTQSTILCTGKLMPGEYVIDGGVSSQFITGLLLSLPIVSGDSGLTIKGRIESEPYIRLTEQVLALFGIQYANGKIMGHYPFEAPSALQVEGDWSNSAFFLTANALGSQIHISNLNQDSVQGDKEIYSLIPQLHQNHTISVAQIPDLMPILAVLAAAKEGATFTDIQRLRLKESDRVASVAAMLQAMGVNVIVSEASMTVYPAIFHGATIDSCNDHRIAMAAAIAATVSQGNITILNAQCVAKSYPTFWEEYGRLGGKYEQYIR